jgi:hypothetical protein
LLSRQVWPAPADNLQPRSIPLGWLLPTGWGLRLKRRVGRAGDKIIRCFAVNSSDPAESNIRPDAVPVIGLGDVTVAGETSWKAARREICNYLALTGLVVLFVEWYIYIRRVY